jgi:hypothetical protein
MDGVRREDKRRIGYGESGERWVQRAEAKVFANRERYNKAFNHAPSLKSIAPDIKAFRKLCIHTLYVCAYRKLTTFYEPESVGTYLQRGPSVSILGGWRC